MERFIDDSFFMKSFAISPTPISSTYSYFLSIFSPPNPSAVPWPRWSHQRREGIHGGHFFMTISIPLSPPLTPYAVPHRWSHGGGHSGTKQPSTGPLSRRSLASLLRSLAPHCSLCSRSAAFIRSLANSLTPELVGKGMIRCP